MPARAPNHPLSNVADFDIDGGQTPSIAEANAAGAPATFGGAALTQVLYLTERGDTTAISANDIHQGQIGDCFLLSSIGELALYHPGMISSMIHATGSGSGTVSLFSGLNGQTAGFGATAFKPLLEAVTNSFSASSVDNGATQDVLGTSKEIWPQILEKAYAQANGGYAGIQNGGNPCIALQELTGHTAQWEAPASATLAALMKNVMAGDLVVMDTGAGSSQFNLVGHHAYMFEGIQTTAGVASVKLGNPWGFDQPALVPVAMLSKAFVEVDIGHVG